MMRDIDADSGRPFINIAQRVRMAVDEFEYLFKRGSGPQPALRPSAQY